MALIKKKVGERFRIGDQILITVLAIRYPRVHLKIDVPESLPIWREESYQQAKGSKRTDETTVEICAWLCQTVGNLES